MNPPPPELATDRGHRRGPVPARHRWLHGLFALLGFLFFNVQALGSATQLRGAMRALSVIVGGLGLVFVVLMAIGDAGNTAVFGPIGHGGTERMIVYPVTLWMVAFGGYLLGTRDATGTASTAGETADQGDARPRPEPEAHIPSRPLVGDDDHPRRRTGAPRDRPPL